MTLDWIFIWTHAKIKDNAYILASMSKITWLTVVKGSILSLLGKK